METNPIIRPHAHVSETECRSCYENGKLMGERETLKVFGHKAFTKLKDDIHEYELENPWAENVPIQLLKGWIDHVIEDNELQRETRTDGTLAP